MLSGLPWKFLKIDSQTGLKPNSRGSLELFFQTTKLFHNFKAMKLDPLASTQEPNGLVAFMLLEIKPNAVHAGLLLPLKLFQIDSALPQRVQSTLFFHHKIWSLAIRVTTDAMVDISTSLGNILNKKVLLLMIASHTNLVQAVFHLA